jgi:hypothetical protein
MDSSGSTASMQYSFAFIRRGSRKTTKSIVMSQAPLFREAAQDAQRTRTLGETIRVRPVSFAFLTAAAACMASVVMLF